LQLKFELVCVWNAEASASCMTGDTALPGRKTMREARPRNPVVSSDSTARGAPSVMPR